MPTILVCDDQPALRELVRAALAEAEPKPFSPRELAAVVDELVGAES